MNEKIDFKVKNRVKITDDKFEILTFDNYKNLERYNYNTKQLKLMCKKHKLKLSGNKVDLQTRLYNFLKYYKYATYIQKTYRGYLVRKINKLKGHGSLPSLCCNNQDFITLDELSNLSYYNFFSFKHNNHTYGFDLMSIYVYIVKKKETKNPYDRSTFSHEIKNKLLELRRLSKIANIPLMFQENILEKKKTLVDIFNRIDELGNYTNIQWFDNLENNKLIKFYRELYDIWIYRANISQDVKYKISSVDPFFNIKPNFFKPYTTPEIKNILMRVMEKLLYNAIDIEFQKMGAMYILTALTLVSEPAASALPWLYYSVI